MSDAASASPDPAPPDVAAADPDAPTGHGGVHRLRLVIFLQMLGIGVAMSFASIWMRRHGLGETLIGAFQAAGTLVGFATGLLWGQIADRTQRPDRVAMLGYLGLAAAWCLLAHATAVWAFALYAVLFGVVLGMVSQTVPTMVMAMLPGGANGRGYALYRIFGSLGFIVGAMVLSSLFRDVKLMILLAAAAALLAPLPLLGIHARIRRERHYVSLGRLLENRRLMALFAAIFFYALAIPAIFRFLPLYAERLGADEALVGRIIAVNGFAALVGLPLAGVIVDRFGPRLMILLALAVQPLRCASYALITEQQWLFAPQLLHLLTWAAMEVGGILYVTRVAAPGNKATAVAAFAGVQTLGGVAGAAMAGYLAEHHGYPAMFTTIAAVAAVGPLLFTAALLRERRHTAAANTTLEPLVPATADA